jgi:hypothetical protein
LEGCGVSGCPKILQITKADATLLWPAAAAAVFHSTQWNNGTFPTFCTVDLYAGFFFCAEFMLFLCFVPIFSTQKIMPLCPWVLYKIRPAFGIPMHYQTTHSAIAFFPSFLLNVMGLLLGIFY